MKKRPSQKRSGSSKSEVKPFHFPVFRSLILLLLAVGVLLMPGYVNAPGAGNGATEDEPVPIVLPDIRPAPYPINITGAPDASVSAQAVVVRDAVSGVYLMRKNEREHLSPASTTKIMTALVALDSFSLDDIVTIREVTDSGQLMGLFEGERISVENLLYGALIHSGNDAADALARYYPGGTQAFVDEMNRKAKSYHLYDSSFTNPMGFDDPGQKVTAQDLSLLASQALENKTLMKMVALPSITVSDATYTYYHQLKNINQLIGRIPGVAGLKTGWTEDAGENLVTVVERDGRKIIFVVLKSADRFADTTALIDWVFSNFSWKEFGPELER